jgi:pimeloyl-ACP methyl ester carboxylesterase
VELTAHHPFRSAQAKERYLNFYDTRAERWPVPFETRMVETKYGQTFVRVSGPADGPPLILQHGIAATSLMWMPNIKAWSAKYRIYAVDSIHDFGRSVSTQVPTAPGDFVDWLDELFTALDLGDDINLIGMSYGGWLTTQYALEHQDRLAKIVLLAPAASVMPLPWQFMVYSILSLIPLRSVSSRPFYWLMKDLVGNGEEGRREVAEWAESVFLGERCFKRRWPVAPTVLSDEELRRIQIPTLYLVGENEKIYSGPDAVERLKMVAPHMQAELLPDAGHDLNVVQAELVNRLVLDFLGQP